MTWTASPRYKVGDRVISTSWGRSPGVVTRAGRGATLAVLWDDGSKDERARAHTIRPETTADVQQRERAAAMQAWQGARPHTTFANVETGSYSTAATVRAVVVYRTTTAAEMRQAADELRLLADWFEQKPLDE